jgi:predicted P-loop ATPase
LRKKTIAYTNSFHPVRDYLTATQPTWDEVKRVGCWLTTYLGVEDNAYTRAVGMLMLVAAVRRVRQPGCKFDEMLILENPTQGTGRSTALEILAVNEEWYTDDLPLGVRGKELMEAIVGKWIIEVGELSGMRKAEVQSVKATLSRRIDRARKAYGRPPTTAHRQSVFIGTTNDEEYLRDITGNRRFWPVLCGMVDLVALRRDIHQLWAEAATLEAGGMSIRLPEELWPLAAAEQAKRLPPDEWFAILKETFEERKLEPEKSYKIPMTSVWTILNVPEHLREHNASLRVGNAMRALGWQRPNRQGRIKVNGETLSGFIKGKSPWTNVIATRNFGHLIVDVKGETAQDPDGAQEADLDGCGPHEGE